MNKMRKMLRMENKRLEQQADKFLDAHMLCSTHKQSIQDENVQSVPSLELMIKELETLTSTNAKLKMELSMQEEKHHSETNRLREILNRAEKEKTESALMNKQVTENLEKRATAAETENKRLEREATELKILKAVLRTKLSISIEKLKVLRSCVAGAWYGPSYLSDQENVLSDIEKWFVDHLE